LSCQRGPHGSDRTRLGGAPCHSHWDRLIRAPRWVGSNEAPKDIVARVGRIERSVETSPCASVGSTESSESLLARFGVVGPTRASFASAARIPQSGAKGSTTSRFPDSTRALGVDEVTTDLVPRETVESHPGHLDVRSEARKAGDLRRSPPEPGALPGLGTIESACGRDQGPYSANLGDVRSGPPATGMNSGRSPASIALTRRSRLISRRQNRGRRDRFHGRPISQARL
jgi:hypothetical protein